MQPDAYNWHALFNSVHLIVSQTLVDQVLSDLDGQSFPIKLIFSN